MYFHFGVASHLDIIGFVFLLSPHHINQMNLLHVTLHGNDNDKIRNTSQNDWLKQQPTSYIIGKQIFRSNPTFSLQFTF